MAPTGRLRTALALGRTISNPIARLNFNRSVEMTDQTAQHFIIDHNEKAPRRVPLLLSLLL